MRIYQESTLACDITYTYYIRLQLKNIQQGQKLPTKIIVQVCMVTQQASQAPHNYGVTRDSILNTLNFFHVTSGLPPDIMHDIFEGVAVVK